jgi:hypothetical protein
MMGAASNYKIVIDDDLLADVPLFYPQDPPEVIPCRSRTSLAVLAVLLGPDVETGLVHQHNSP